MAGVLQFVARLRLVLAHAKLRVLLIKVLEALFEQVHLRIEDLRIPMQVDVTVQLSKRLPKGRSPLLTELAVKDQNGLGLHQLSQHHGVVQEVFH